MQEGCAQLSQLNWNFTANGGRCGSPDIRRTFSPSAGSRCSSGAIAVGTGRIAITAVNLVRRIAGSVLDVAQCLLDLVLYLLGCAIYLGTGVACPLADLTLCATGYVVDGALHCVLVHKSTSVDSFRLSKKRFRLRPNPRLPCEFRLGWVRNDT